MPDAPLCVYCRQRPASDEFRPFCSERCKMADLGRWMSGQYSVPVRPETDSDAADAPLEEVVKEEASDDPEG